MRVTLKNENDRCPITYDAIKDLEDPIVVKKTGWIYSRSSLKAWCQSKAALGDLKINDPATNIDLPEIKCKNNTHRFFCEFAYDSAYMQVYAVSSVYLAYSVAGISEDPPLSMFVRVYLQWVCAYLITQAAYPREVFTKVRQVVFPDRHGLAAVLQENDPRAIDEWLAENVQPLQDWKNEAASNNAEEPASTGVSLSR